MKDPNQLINYWVNEIVIGLNLCPFAKLPYEKGLMKTRYFEEFNLDKVRSEIEKTTPTAPLENILFVYPNLDISFVDFHTLKEDLLLDLEQSPWDLIAFHPKFQFVSEPFKNRVNYVNRSPFPLLHLIQKKDLSSIPQEDGKKLNVINEHTLEALDQKKIDKLFFYLKN